MTYGFHAEAEEEPNQAIDYYNECQLCLAGKFHMKYILLYKALSIIPEHGPAFRRIPAAVS